MGTYVSAKREKETALDSSSVKKGGVKVKALDVVASQKIKVSLVLLPLYQLTLSCIVCYYFGAGLKAFFILTFVFWPSFTYMATRVCDRFEKMRIHCNTNFY